MKHLAFMENIFMDVGMTIRIHLMKYLDITSNLADIREMKQRLKIILDRLS